MTDHGTLELPASSRGLLEGLGRTAWRQKQRSFLVGGPVRDLMLGIASPDIDVAVERDSREFGSAVAKELGGRFVYHARFLTGTVLFEKSQDTSSGNDVRCTTPPSQRHIDITRARTETYSRPAVLPRVEPATIEEDLGRRDFAINAMACELTPRSLGAVIDPLGGRTDLARRTVRVLHDRSFIDDPTRIFRCIRFATRFGFEVEPHTLDLMRRAIEEKLPGLLTPERVLYELRLICAEPMVLPMVEALVREGVLRSAWGWTPPPELLPALGHMRQLRAAPDLLFLYLLSTLPVTDRFPIRREERAAARWIAGFGKVRPKLARASRPSAVAKLLRAAPAAALDVLALTETGAVGSIVRLYLERLARTTVSVTGADLRELGVKPGPRYREILDEVLYARLDGRVTTVAGELALCRRLAGKRVKR